MYALGQVTIFLIILVIILSIKQIRTKYIWWEYMLQLFIPTVIVTIVWFTATASMKMDTEYWGNTCVSIQYEESYEWWNTCSYTVDCNCTTDKDGNTSCDQCCVAACDYESASWYAIDERGRRRSIREDEYNTIKKKWGLEEYDTGDTNGTANCRIGKIYRVDWDNNMETYQIIVTKHKYENKVRFEATYFYPQYTEDQLTDVYGYPVIQGLDQDHVIGDWYNSSDQQAADHILDIHNGTYGPKPREDQGQVKVFMFVYTDKDRSYAVKQKDKLEGGNKNEYILVLGFNSLDNSIMWYEIITYCDNGSAVNRMKEWLYANPNSTLEEIAEAMTDVLENNWERREFTPLNAFIKLKPKPWVWVLAYILNVIISVGMIFVFSNNENYNSGSRHYY
jgi:hypothetical protein